MNQLKIFAVLGLVLLAGCALKTKVLDAAAVSMTKSNLVEGEKLQETGQVTGKFCSDTFGDKGTIGLIDESVKQAQQQSGVDFIVNAAFWAEGSCMTVEGTGAKIASSGMSAPAPAPAAPAHGKPMMHKKHK
jgi:hypothetical protein